MVGVMEGVGKGFDMLTVVRDTGITPSNAVEFIAQVNGARFLIGVEEVNDGSVELTGRMSLAMARSRTMLSTYTTSSRSHSRFNPRPDHHDTRALLRRGRIEDRTCRHGVEVVPTLEIRTRKLQKLEIEDGWAVED